MCLLSLVFLWSSFEGSKSCSNWFDGGQILIPWRGPCLSGVQPMLPATELQCRNQHTTVDTFLKVAQQYLSIQHERATSTPSTRHIGCWSSDGNGPHGRCHPCFRKRDDFGFLDIYNRFAIRLFPHSNSKAPAIFSKSNTVTDLCSLYSPHPSSYRRSD
jgi:hypothetical protein